MVSDVERGRLRRSTVTSVTSVHQNDEILALARNEVVTNSAGERSWEGTFVNTNRRTRRDVAVTVNFLDSQDRPVGKAEAEADELTQGERRWAAPRLAVRSPPRLSNHAVRRGLD
jgi:hypothetical protein